MRGGRQRSGDWIRSGPTGAPPPNGRAWETGTATPVGALVRYPGALYYDRVAAKGWLCTGATSASWIDVSTLGGGITIRTRGALGAAGARFNVSLGVGGADVTGPFEVAFACKVATATDALVRLLVNDSDFNPFKDAGTVMVWGQGVPTVHAFPAINELAGNPTYDQQTIIANDVFRISIRCDVPEQSMGMGLRTVRITTTHVSTSTISCPVVETLGVFTLDENYTEGQNVLSVGVFLDGGTWDAASNYSLSRLNP